MKAAHRRLHFSADTFFLKAVRCASSGPDCTAVPEERYCQTEGTATDTDCVETVWDTQCLPNALEVCAVGSLLY